MKRKDHTDLLNARLTELHLQSAKGHVTLHEDAEGFDGHPPRAEIAVGYMSGTRFKVTTSSNLPSMRDMIQLLDDKNRLCTLIDLGVSFMPADKRPELPSWIKGNSQAPDILNQMRRASDAAKKAALAPSGGSEF